MKRVLKQRLRRSVIVTLKSKVAFRGVLYDHDGEALVLRQVEHLTVGAPTPVDGELVVFVADVDTLQLV